MWWCFGGKWWYFRVEVDMMRKDLTSLTSHLGWIRSSHMNVNTCECVYIYMCVCWGQGGQLALSLCESGRHAHTGQSGGCPWWQGWREDAETNTHIHTHNIRENTDLQWDTGSESQCWAMLSASLGGETKHKSTEEPQHVLSQELQNQPRNHKRTLKCSFSAFLLFPVRYLLFQSSMFTSNTIRVSDTELSVQQSLRAQSSATSTYSGYHSFFYCSIRMMLHREAPPTHFGRCQSDES